MFHLSWGPVRQRHQHCLGWEALVLGIVFNPRAGLSAACFAARPDMDRMSPRFGWQLRSSGLVGGFWASS